MQLDGKVAVVLGASAAGGTGWAIAEALAAEGARVVVGARRIVPLRELADKIGGLAVQCDGGKEEEIAALARAASEHFGRIDIAVNLAFQPVNGFIGTATQADIQASLNVNYIGQVHFIRCMAEMMNDGGSIVIISSAAANQPTHARFAYGCAKAATDCLVRYAALEYGPRGIRVNSILPGPIKTGASAPIFEEPGTEAAFAREIPLGRVGVPEDYGQVVLWLAQSPFVTGVNLPVSGGMQLNRVPRVDEVPGLSRRAAE